MLPLPPEDKRAPRSPGVSYDGGWEPLFCHSLSPLIALTLYGTTLAGTAHSRACRILSSPLLVSLGSHSLAVYLFQFITPYALPLSVPWSVAGGGSSALAYAVVLWLVSAIYTELVETPLIAHLRARCCEWVARLP